VRPRPTCPDPRPAVLDRDTPNFVEPIAALASPPGPAARGILRLSGERRTLLELLAQRFVAAPEAPHNDAPPAARFAHAARPVCLKGAWEIDRRAEWAAEPDAARLQMPADVWYWPGPRSYTGGPLVEIHTVGSPPLLEALLEGLARAGFRLARPGEFTLRAFLSGRMDLLQAEAVLGVIDADTPQQLRTALGQLAGSASRRLDAVRAELLDLLAELEAGLDFAEEGIRFVESHELQERLARVAESLEASAASAAAQGRSQVRRRVVLAGPPNAGKSTLFNALVGGPAALVSPVAGTTRDYLSVERDWNGLPIELIDTAGLVDPHACEDDSPLPAAAAAARASRERLQQADLVLWCEAAPAQPQPPEFSPFLLVRTCCDRLPEGAWRPGADDRGVVSVCAPRALGLSELQAAVAGRLASPGEGSDLLGTTSARCRDSLLGAAAAVRRAIATSKESAGEELTAIEIRAALDHLGAITGELGTDELLDRIFSRFCIGK